MYVQFWYLRQIFLTDYFKLIFKLFEHLKGNKWYQINESNLISDSLGDKWKERKKEKKTSLPLYTAKTFVKIGSFDIKLESPLGKSLAHCSTKFQKTPAKPSTKNSINLPISNSKFQTRQRLSEIIMWKKKHNIWWFSIRHYSRVRPPRPAVIRVSNNVAHLGPPNLGPKPRQLLSLPPFPGHQLPGKNWGNSSHVAAVSWSSITSMKLKTLSSNLISTRTL